MKVIYHIFKANVHFLTLGLIESIIRFSEHRHFFVVVGINESNQYYYDDLFLKYHYSQYIYINEKSSSKVTRLLSNISKRLLKIEFHNFEIDLIKYISSLSNQSIILHADYSTAFYLLLRLKTNMNKNWVCWGYIYYVQEGCKIIRDIRNSLYKSIYNSYTNIICLMEEDCEELRKLYKLKNTNFLPYYNELPLRIEKLSLKEAQRGNAGKILLGNSGRCIDFYYDDLKRLKKYIKNNISVDCMLNYGSTEKQNIKLNEAATILYGSKFKAHTVLWPKEQYYDFMNHFDIYISSIISQSGLGAIYLMLLLGKKVFLAGKNYDHLKKTGAVVFHSDQINELSFQDFCRPLTTEEKEQNKTVIMKLLDCETLSLKWDQLYSTIIDQTV